MKQRSANILNNTVASFEDAVNVYKQFSDVARKSSAVVRFQLSDISKYCDEKQAVLRRISRGLTEQTLQALEKLELLNIEVETLQSAKSTLAFPSSISPPTHFLVRPRKDLFKMRRMRQGRNDSTAIIS